METRRLSRGGGLLAKLLDASGSQQVEGGTALHVGARRGCVELIKQVCTIFKVTVGMEGVSNPDHFRVPGAKPAANEVYNIPDLNDIPDLDNNLGYFESFSDSEILEDHVVIWNLMSHKTDPIDESRDENIETASSPPSNNTKLENEGDVPKEYFDGEDDNKIAQDKHLDASALSLKSFDEFYHSKDGRYNLEAFAIAVLNGNFDVISLLADAYLHLRSEELRDRPNVGHACMLAYLELEPQIWEYRVDFPVWKEAARKEEVERLLRERKKRTLLKKVVNNIIGEFIAVTSDKRILERAYSKHRDFNFLPQNEFIFHYLATISIKEWAQETGGLDKLRLPDVWKFFWKRVRRELEDVDLWKFVLQLQDGQGRAPSHAALDQGLYRLYRLRQSLGARSKAWRFIQEEVVDGAGRTLLHRALASNQWDIVVSTLDNPSWPKMVSICCESFRHSAPRDLLMRKGLVLNVDVLSLQNGFHGIRNFGCHDKEFGTRFRYPPTEIIWGPAFDALYNMGAVSAVERESVGFQKLRVERVECLQEQTKYAEEFPVPFYLFLAPRNPTTSPATTRRTLRIMYEALRREMEETKSFPLYSYPFEARVYTQREIIPKCCGPAEFAVLSGDVEWARQVFEAITEKGKVTRRMRGIEKFLSKDRFLDVSAFHLAAASGNYEMLKLCIDNSELFIQNNIFGEDNYGNTPLHYAFKGKISFNSHLLDYVSSSNIGVNDDPRIKGENSMDDDLIGRKGCINLLLEMGCDMFKENNKREAPHPSGSLKGNQKLIEWWYDKRIKEFDSIQSTMSIAANAISVTAALVATASYVGPLQPPLGYGGASNDLQVEMIWIRMFIVCDTLSFYLAVGAIICSLIPSLPVPQQAMIDELRRTRMMVSLAVAILFPSVVLVLLAFVASSIAVVSSNPSSLGGLLTFVTTTIGTIVFVIIALLFLVKFLIILLPRNSWMKYIYRKTSF